MTVTAPDGPDAAWVDGVPLKSVDVDARMAVMRAADRAGALPAEGTREWRQLRRWVTQVLVVERLCRAEVPPTSAEWGAIAPTRADAVALGSVAAAAWASEPAVPLAAEAVTREVRLDAAVLERSAALGATWSADELLVSARLEEFARWLAGATHERVRLAQGYEHPGDSSQPDNLHRH